MDVGIIGKEALLRSMEEVCAVVDACLFTGRATKDLRLPSVEMAVKVNDTDWTICTSLISASFGRKDNSEYSPVD